MDEEILIMVPKATWENLLKRTAWLDALEAAGVDNWEGISYAHEIYNDESGNDED